MKTKTIKTNEELLVAMNAALRPGELLAELVYRDSTLVGLRVGRMRVENTYGITVVRELEYEEVEKHRVRIDHPCFPSLNRYFDSSREADKFAGTYAEMPDVNVSQALVTARLDAQGKVVGEVIDDTFNPLTPQENGGDDLPF